MKEIEEAAIVGGAEQSRAEGDQFEMRKEEQTVDEEDEFGLGFYFFKYLILLFYYYCYFAERSSLHSH